MRFLVVLLATLVAAQQDVCEPNGARTDCGRIGTTEPECLSSGCCWNPVQPNPDNKPWCFRKTAVSPGCRTQPVCSGNGNCNGGGVCVCNVGWATCGPASERDCSVNITSDVRNCGACGRTCPSGGGVASSTCVASKCVVSCRAGFSLCHGECVAGNDCSAAAPFQPADMFQIQTFFLNNINPPGQCDGCVLASPSRAQPDYYYHWARDGAISVAAISKFLSDTNPNANARLTAYLGWVKRVQFAAAPNGIDVRGEPKFFVNGRTFDGGWMRPQNDGPPLRAATLTMWALRLIAAGRRDYVAANMYSSDSSKPGIKRDLEYVMTNWQLPTGDPWEEVRGPCFFAKIAARKALVLGAQLARNMSDPLAADAYSLMARNIEKDLDAVHWSPSKTLIMEMPNIRELDSAVHLGVLYGSLDDGFYTPASSKVQSSVAHYVNAFSGSYFRINVIDNEAGIPGLLTGRYLHDEYNGGNSSQPGAGHAWILTTASLAEIYYRAGTELVESGAISVNDLNRQYYHQVLELSAPLVASASSMHAREQFAQMLEQKSDFTLTAEADGEVFESVINALALTADGILLRIRHHVKDHGFHCSEQINKDMGAPQGAQDLTWSYGTIIGAMAARQRLTEVVAAQRRA